MSRRSKEKRRKRLMSETGTRADGEGASEGKLDERAASAHAVVKMHPLTLEMIMEKRAPGGDALETARVAGEVAARKAGDITPHCRPKNLSRVKVRIEAAGRDRVGITADAAALASDDVDTEAIAAVTAAALTIYDMCRHVDRAIIITDVRLLRKSGGDEADYVAESV